jgi:asparagine synthase (glutamine-hydrolysing)
MCGIAGILDTVRFPSQEEIARMVSILRHRGPDADGFLMDGPLAMGMRRLSIIDLSTGDQPICNEDGSVVVVFNGEIYNYLELREGLQRRGHHLKTKGDTEVLVHLYEDQGVGMLPHLNGMFAFAVWDRTRRRLLLVRDRMGVKPLYYAKAGSRFLFASELKSLKTCPYLDPTLDYEALADYLRLGYIPRDASPLRQVRRLLPGHCLVVENGHLSLQPWWKLEEVAGEAPFADAEQRRSELTDLFEDAVRIRMRSDVPVASFLSGGLDSSLISASAARHSPLPLQTYHVRFQNTVFDEAKYARSVAQQSHTDHSEAVASLEDAITQLPQLLWYMDEPIADSAIIPSYLVSRLAAHRVKVCLSGLGGDELFGGYSRYVDGGTGRVKRFACAAPSLARSLVPVLEHVRPIWAEEVTLATDTSLAWRRYLRRLEIFDTKSLWELGFRTAGRTDSLMESLWNCYPGLDPIGHRQFIDQHTYLPDQILALTDRMSMAASLEARMPFMDFRLVQFAAQLPGGLKQSADDFKIYLKSALGNRVPPEILTRPKWGFDTPLSRWLTTPRMLPLVQRLPDTLSDVVKSAYVQKLVRDGSSVRSYARRVWSLLVLAVWLQVHQSVAVPNGPLEEYLGSPALR